MREKLKDYVKFLFRDAPDTPRNRELREEILQNTLDRFDDLVAQGCAESDAYDQAVASIGDVRQLWEAAPSKAKKRHTGWIIGGCVAAAAVIALIVGLTVYFKRPVPAHYEQSPGSSVDEIVNWAVDLAGEVSEHASEHASEHITGHGSCNYEHADRYTAGCAELTGDISELSIHWLSGSVTVEVCDGDTLSLSETEQSDPALQLHWCLDGEKLILQPCASDVYTNLPAKDLLVRIPTRLAGSLRVLTIDTTSADARVSGLDVETLCFDSVSGSLNARLACANLEADTTSGGMEFIGTASEVELDTVSGNFVLTMTETPGDFSFDSTSGCLTLTIPDDRSFHAELDTVSGELRCAHEVEVRGDTWVYTGAGRLSEAELEFSTVSGCVDICKAQ